MRADGAESTPQVDQLRTIQVRRFDSCPSRCRAAMDEEEIGAPGKVPRPMLAAGVEKRDSAPGPRVAGVSLSVLMTVARRTRPS